MNYDTKQAHESVSLANVFKFWGLAQLVTSHLGLMFLLGKPFAHDAAVDISQNILHRNTENLNQNRYDSGVTCNLYIHQYGQSILWYTFHSPLRYVRFWYSNQYLAVFSFLGKDLVTIINHKNNYPVKIKWGLFRLSQQQNPAKTGTGNRLFFCNKSPFICIKLCSAFIVLSSLVSSYNSYTHIAPAVSFVKC